GALAELAVLAQLLDELAQVGVLLRQLLHLLSVREHGRVAEHGVELDVARLDGRELPQEELVKHGPLPATRTRAAWAACSERGPEPRATSIRWARRPWPACRRRTSC